MSARIEFNQGNFVENMKRLALVKGLADEEIVKYAAKLCTRYAIRFTPPFGRAPVTEGAGLKESKKLGENATRRDVRRVFHSIASLDIYRNPKDEETGKAFKKMVRSGDAAGVSKFLQAAKITWSPVVTNHSAETHKAARNNRGRVMGMKGATLVLRANALRKYEREKIAHVGKAKAGWARAAIALGVKMPLWVKRHNVPGVYNEHKTPFGNVWSVTVGNLVSYQTGFNTGKIMDNAMKVAGSVMKTQANAIMKRRIAKMETNRVQTQPVDA